MTDEEFLEAAIRELPEEVRQAAAACTAAQHSRRLKPSEVRQIAKVFKAKPNPVLALLGWVHSSHSRSNRYIYWDLFSKDVRHFEMQGSGDRDTMLGLAICRTLMSGFSNVPIKAQ